ncbi:MAG: 30S ribosomal protein S3 [Candidatus Omnitrophica bacterium]|nr:30S ribosomal protein S3 [Candidatus Omnitrophota bacterium]
MGQKAHPYGLRLGYIKSWKAKWFAPKNFADLLEEDLKLRKYLKQKLGFAGISNIEIERSSGRVRVRIFTARPGVIIGRRGQEIDKIKEDLAAITHSELFVDIKEVKSPQTDGQLVAENVAMQLEKRVGFRRAMKKAVQMAMTKGALGIKILCKGRLGGAEIARDEKYHEGKVPLSTFRADIDYGFAEAFTTYGTIGCKVWIYKGDILVKKEEAAQRLEREMLAKEEGQAALVGEAKPEGAAKPGRAVRKKKVAVTADQPEQTSSQVSSESAVSESEKGKSETAGGEI